MVEFLPSMHRALGSIRRQYKSDKVAFTYSPSIPKERQKDQYFNAHAKLHENTIHKKTFRF